MLPTLKKKFYFNSLIERSSTKQTSKKQNKNYNNKVLPHRGNYLVPRPQNVVSALTFANKNAFHGEEYRLGQNNHLIFIVKCVCSHSVLLCTLHLSSSCFHAPETGQILLIALKSLRVVCSSRPIVLDTTDVLHTYPLSLLLVVRNKHRRFH